LPSLGRQRLRTLRSHPTHRPRGDLLLPRQNWLVLVLSWQRSAGLGAGGHIHAAPAEVGAIDPHPMEDHREPPGDRNDGTPHPAPLRHPQAPGLEPGPGPTLRQHGLSGLVQHRPQHGVAALRDAAVIVGFAGLVAFRHQSNMGADGLGVEEALGLVDGRLVGQRDDCTDAGGRHQPPAGDRAARARVASCAAWRTPGA